MKKTPFFFPLLGRTILAFSQDEANRIAAWEIAEDTPVDEDKTIDTAKVNNRGVPRRSSNK